MLREYGTLPQNLNIAEINMINRIYAFEMRMMALASMRLHRSQVSTRRGLQDRRRRFYRALAATVYISTLAACSSVHAAPPPQAPVSPSPTCTVQIKTMVIQDAAPTVEPVASFNTKVCGCTDGIVRWGAFCK